MENWSITILPFMTKELKLSGNELILYALIHAHTDDEANAWRCAPNTVSEMLNISRKSVYNLLDKLVEKRLIEKIDGEIPEYKTLYKGFELKAPEKPAEKPVKKSAEKKPSADKYGDIKTAYMNQRKQLFSEGKVKSEFTAVNSALINTRLKTLCDAGISHEVIIATLLTASQDSWILENLDYDLCKILSENVFYKQHGIYTASKRAYVSPMQQIKKPRICPKCGREDNLDGWGRCYSCDFDAILDDPYMDKYNKCKD